MNAPQSEKLRQQSPHRLPELCLECRIIGVDDPLQAEALERCGEDSASMPRFLLKDRERLDRAMFLLDRESD